MAGRSVAVCGTLFLVVVFGSSNAGAASQNGRRLLGSVAGQWAQCGGKSCSWGGCQDSATLSCPDGYGCSRQSEWYWQCLPGASPVNPTQPSQTPAPVVATPAPTPSPTPSPTSAPTKSPSPSPVPVTPSPVTPSPVSSGTTCTVQLAAYSQCGGMNQCAAGACVDAIWPGACCGPDSNGASFSCQRGDQWYWQCRPGGTPTTVPTTITTPSNPSPSPSPVSNPSPSPSPVTTVAPAAPTPTVGSPSGSGNSYLTTVNDQIVDQNGNIVKLHGIAWFGFGEASSAMVEGLTSGYDSQTLDFATVVRRMKALGFNTIKLPFSFNALYSGNAGVYQRGCNKADDATIMKNLIESSVANGASFPSVTDPGACNSYLPSDPMARFNWVINYFATNGFYVVPDWHPGMPSGNRELFDTSCSGYTAGSCWIKNMEYWFKTLITSYPGVVGKLIVDLINEPDSYNLRWEASGGPAIKDLYIGAMDRLYAINTKVPFMVQGTGQAAVANWGDGFVTDYGIIKDKGLSDANPFFQAILTKPYLRQVILGPHVYGPSVSGVNDGSISGWGLWWRMSLSFGTKGKAGYCDPNTGKCNQFALCLGEYGSSFAKQGDKDLHRDMTAYMHNTGASAGDHNPIVSWIFWSWNPSSSDTGGVVGPDWLTVQWGKIDAMVSGLDLKPWFYGS